MRHQCSHAELTAWPAAQVYNPYLLINKKRYAGLLWTKPDKWDKMDAKVRRRLLAILHAHLLSMTDLQIMSSWKACIAAAAFDARTCMSVCFESRKTLCTHHVAPGRKGS